MYRTLREHMETEKSDMLQSMKSDYERNCQSIVASLGCTLDDSRYDVMRRMVMRTGPDLRVEVLLTSLYQAMDPNLFGSRLMMFRPDRLGRRASEIGSVVSEYKSIARDLSDEFGLGLNMDDVYRRLDSLAAACGFVLEENVRHRTRRTPGTH